MSIFINKITKQEVEEQAVRNQLFFTQEIIEDFHLVDTDYCILYDTPFNDEIEVWQKVEISYEFGNNPIAFKKYKVVNREDVSKEDVIRERIANRRYYEETKGVEWNGVLIPTDRNTQSILTSMNLRSDRDPSYVASFKLSPGNYISLDRELLKAVGDLVFDHVEQCFKREEELNDLLSSGEDVTEEAW